MQPPQQLYSHRAGGEAHIAGPWTWWCLRMFWSTVWISWRESLQGCSTSPWPSPLVHLASSLPGRQLLGALAVKGASWWPSGTPIESGRLWVHPCTDSAGQSLSPSPKKHYDSGAHLWVRRVCRQRWDWTSGSGVVRTSYFSTLVRSRNWWWTTEGKILISHYWELWHQEGLGITCCIEIKLMGFLCVWFISWMTSSRRDPQRVINTAQKIISCSLPSLDNLHCSLCKYSTTLWRTFLSLHTLSFNRCHEQTVQV